VTDLPIMYIYFYISPTTLGKLKL